jgi:hypothetical protein
VERDRGIEGRCDGGYCWIREEEVICQLVEEEDFFLQSLI